MAFKDKDLVEQVHAYFCFLIYPHFELNISLIRLFNQIYNFTKPRMDMYTLILFFTVVDARFILF